MPIPVHLQSASVDDIVGREPSWIVRSGSVLIFTIFTALLLLTWFIKYPDTISAQVVLTTASPPVELVSSVDARIVDIFVDDEQVVKKDAPLMLLESDVEYESLIQLEKQVGILRQSLAQGQSTALMPFSASNPTFGQLQGAVNGLVNAVNEYALFIHSKSYQNQIESSESLLASYGLLHNQLLSKKRTQQRKVSIEKENFNRNKALIDKGVLAESNLVTLENRFLDRNLTLDDLNIQLELNNVKQQEIRSEIAQTKIRLEEKRQALLFDIKQALSTLDSKVAAWKKNYLVTAPISGKVALANYWSANQQIRRGDVALFVYNDASNMIGKLFVSHLGAGKIQHNQRVSVELSSYPALEFGKVLGVVENVSGVPDQKGYSVDIALPQNLVTSYGKALKFSPNMVGTARIITQDRRLLERFFDKIIYALDDA